MSENLCGGKGAVSVILKLDFLWFEGIYLIFGTFDFFVFLTWVMRRTVAIINPKFIHFDVVDFSGHHSKSYKFLLTLSVYSQNYPSPKTVLHACFHVQNFLNSLSIYNANVWYLKRFSSIHNKEFVLPCELSPTVCCRLRRTGVDSP